MAKATAELLAALNSLMSRIWGQVFLFASESAFFQQEAQTLKR